MKTMTVRKAHNESPKLFTLRNLNSLSSIDKKIFSVIVLIIMKNIDLEDPNQYEH